MQGAQQLPKPLGVAAIQSIGDVGDKIGIERVVLVQSEVFQINVKLRSALAVRPFGEVARFTAHADLPRLCTDG